MTYLKKSLAFALALMFVFMLFGCEQNSDGEEAPSVDTASENVIADVTLPTYGEATSGELLIYYQNFENCNLLKANKTVFRDLGWSEESILSGASSNSTASLRILDYNDSRRLYVENNQSGGTDSYITVLDAKLLGKYHETNYTYQYDIVYTDASNTSRYLALVSEYDGNFYNSFHLRNRGTANNECYNCGKWYTYDDGDAADTGDSSIIQKILGTQYDADAQALNEIDLSVRYVVDWENGNSVYIRVNTEGYTGSGKWTLVSSANKASDSFSCFSPDKGGGALALKVGGKQNGYIDNIIVWRGTGEEPEDKSACLVDTLSDECSGHTLVGGASSCLDQEHCKYCGLVTTSVEHSFVPVNGDTDRRCADCAVLESEISDENWLLTRVPKYEGGKYSNKLYECGQGIDDNTFPYEDESLMMLISETDAEQFDAYCRKLVESYDYEEVYRFTRDGNIYVQLKQADRYLYTYYTASTSEVRVIDDISSYTSTSDFGYKYEKQEGDTTVLYQIGLPMNTNGININKSTEKKIDCGMMYAIKSADNSVIIIDGGGHQQFDDDQCDFLMDFLREITGTTVDEKVKISAWYITHGHSDHMAGFCLFSKKYHNSIDLERIMFNFASVYSNDSTQSGAVTNYHKLLGYINDYYRDDDVKFVKMHTGQVFELADVKISVLYTHEDAVNPTLALTEVQEDYNNGSTVSVFEFDGKKFLLTGDINRIAMNVIIEQNSAETLKSDIVQCAHHCLNNVYELYDLAQATVVLMPQSPLGCKTSSRAQTFANVTKYLENDMIFYASEGTYGVAVIDGKIVQTYYRECVGGEYENWGW